MTASLMAFMRALVSPLFSPAARTATANGTGVDRQATNTGTDGVAVVYLDSAAGTGTSPTLDFKLQESDDNSTFTDVPTAEIVGGAFTQVTNAASQQTRYVDLGPRKRYLRGVATIGGTTPSFTFAAVIAQQRKQS